MNPPSAWRVVAYPPPHGTHSPGVASAAHALSADPRAPPSRPTAVRPVHGRCSSPRARRSATGARPASTPGPASSPTPAPALTPEAAADAVRAFTPLFDGLGPRDPNLIGQGSWWTASPIAGTAGPSPSPSAGATARPAASTTTVDVDRGPGRHARSRGDRLGRDAGGPGAAQRRVEGHGCRRAGGGVALLPGRAGQQPLPPGRSGERCSWYQGGRRGRPLHHRWQRPVPDPARAGSYTLVPQPVEGLMGTAKPTPFTVRQGAQAIARSRLRHRHPLRLTRPERLLDPGQPSGPGGRLQSPRS